MTTFPGLQRVVWLCAGLAVLGIAGTIVVWQGSRDEPPGRTPPVEPPPGRTPPVEPPPARTGGIRLTDMTATTGITFRHDDGGSG